MVCGLVTLYVSLLLTADGFIYPLILLLSTMSFLDFKVNSLDISILLPKNGRVLITTGFMKDLTTNTYGVFPIKCGVG